MKRVVSTALAALSLLKAAPAAAIDRDACAIPYEEAQVLRKQRAFSAAVEQLELCRAKCPGVLASDCTEWAAELKALTPTAVFRVHDPAGSPFRSFRASINGALLSDSPGETPVAVDPGEHVFRFEGAGFVATELHVTLNEGEHRRVIDVTVTPIASSPPRATDASAASESRPSHAAAYTLAGVGAAALVAGGAMAIAGFAEKASLSGSCAPSCSPGSVDTVRTLWWAGGISAAAGAAALTIGVLIWPRAHAKSGASAWWAPSIGPSTLGVIGAF